MGLLSDLIHFLGWALERRRTKKDLFFKCLYFFFPCLEDCWWGHLNLVFSLQVFKLWSQHFYCPIPYELTFPLPFYNVSSDIAFLGVPDKWLLSRCFWCSYRHSISLWSADRAVNCLWRGFYRTDSWHVGWWQPPEEATVVTAGGFLV